MTGVILFHAHAEDTRLTVAADMLQLQTAETSYRGATVIMQLNELRHLLS